MAQAERPRRWESAHEAAQHAQVAYWRTQLAGAPALLELPTDRARPVEPSGRGACVNIELPAEILRGLNELASSVGATLFMALLAAWQVRTLERSLCMFASGLVGSPGCLRGV